MHRGITNISLPAQVPPFVEASSVHDSMAWLSFGSEQD
jgi:hypothetical protein